MAIDKYRYGEYAAMYPLFSAWAEQAARCRSGEITKAQYDQWRYNQ